MVKNYETKDSGGRKDYSSGMRRDITKGKERFGSVKKEIVKNLVNAII